MFDVGRKRLLSFLLGHHRLGGKRQLKSAQREKQPRSRAPSHPKQNEQHAKCHAVLWRLRQKHRDNAGDAVGEGTERVDEFGGSLAERCFVRHFPMLFVLDLAQLLDDILGLAGFLEKRLFIFEQIYRS